MEESARCLRLLVVVGRAAEPVQEGRQDMYDMEETHNNIRAEVGMGEGTGFDRDRRLR